MRRREESGSHPPVPTGESPGVGLPETAGTPEDGPRDDAREEAAARSDGDPVEPEASFAEEPGVETPASDAIDRLWDAALLSLSLPAGEEGKARADGSPEEPDPSTESPGWTEADPPWKLHDFRRPRPLSGPQIQALDAIHCRFARSLSAALSVLMRSRVHVDLVSLSQRSYFDFIRSLANPTSLHVVHASPHPAPLVLELNLDLLFPMIERVLGGNGEGLRQPARPLTRIEQRLAGRVVERILGVLAETWDPGPELRLDLAESEHNPLLVQIVGPTEPTLVLAFEVAMGFQSGSLHLALPLRPLDLLISRLIRVAGAAGADPRGNAYQRERLLRRLGSSPVTLTAELPSIPIRLQDLLTLRPGDMIDTLLPKDAEAIVRVEGQRLFRGAASREDERTVLRISRRDSE